ncbi:MAG: hypothetical protein WBA57_21385 [Elainellaceae cyanobacterium]
MQPNFNEAVLGRCELILMALGCSVPDDLEPVNFNMRLLELLDEILACLGGSVGGEGAPSSYAPQLSNGDPNGAIAARWDYDLAVDALNSNLYYSPAQGSASWVRLS